MDGVLDFIFKQKYEGCSLSEIYQSTVKEFGKEVYAEGTIRNNLAPTGMWFALYEEYRKRRNRLKESEARDIFRKQVGMAASVLVNGLQNELDRIKVDTDKLEAKKKNGSLIERGDYPNYNPAIDIANMILNRVGIGNAARSPEDDDDSQSDLKTMSDDQFRKLLEQHGIDPSTVFGAGDGQKKKEV